MVQEWRILAMIEVLQCLVFLSVIPAKAGIQKEQTIDSRFRGNDKLWVFSFLHSAFAIHNSPFVLWLH